MLGTGRRRVSLAAADLQNAGLIENMRGTIRILNRKSLEEAACECYGVIQHFNGGLGPQRPTPNSLPPRRDGALPLPNNEAPPRRPPTPSLPGVPAACFLSPAPRSRLK